jgi:hypothetical protein
LRCADRQLTALAYPPTRKKIGITWRIHVRKWVQVVTERRWSKRRPSGNTWGAAISQWPNTTTMIEAARRKST